MSLHVGTSGWSYPEWRPAFYPSGLPRARFLEYYASRLGACEVNVTAHRLQGAGAVAAWARAAAPGFRFVCKVHRGVTHREGAVPVGLAERFAASLAPLGDALAGVLVQFPEERARDDALATRVMELLAPVGPVVMEFRHPSWDEPAVREAVAAAGGTTCLTHTEGPPPGRLPPGPLAYVRLRADAYPEPERSRWRDLLRREAATRPVVAIARHRDLPPDDPHSGLGLARWMEDAAPDRG
ncbi:MAG: DUF72 domain-containing protein [Thermoleophilia bacterium]|nr:DUF72 domain-containing protein [Thermoleophilia bacterium]